MGTWTRFGVKPRISKNTQGLYWCHDKQTGGSGWGATVTEAYADWKRRDSVRSLFPRAGVREKKSCMAWYRAGCPPIGSYIGGKQIVSYLPQQDVLVLRG